MNSQISLEVDAALNVVPSILALLESVGVAAGPVGLGVSAAAALAPLVMNMISKLTQVGAIDAKTQAEQLHRMANLLDFSGPQWVPSTAPQPAPPIP